MAWIESHQTLAKHPKLFRLADTLGIHPAQAIGHLHLFWWWAIDYARDGDLSRFRDGEIARACEWPGDAAAFVNALREAGWIDPSHTIHAWQQYTGRLITFRELKQAKDAARQAAFRRQLAADSPATPAPPAADSPAAPPRLACDSPATPAIPHRTQPNPTGPHLSLLAGEPANARPPAGANGLPAPKRRTANYAAQPPSEAEFLEAVKAIALAPEEKLKCYNHYAAQGWVIGKTGRPIKSLLHTVAAWQPNYLARLHGQPPAPPEIPEPPQWPDSPPSPEPPAPPQLPAPSDSPPWPAPPTPEKLPCPEPPATTQWPKPTPAPQLPVPPKPPATLVLIEEPPASPETPDLAQQLAAVDAELRAIRARGHHDEIAGLVPDPTDKDRYYALKTHRRALRKQLAP